MQNDKKDDDNSALKNDPGTEHTTDPQEHMEGPISSLMQGIADKAEENDEKDSEEKEEGK
ncbi:MAG TPA: hypothetical protein VHB70_10945 [Parafilimonas sp.]|nr:hypothetical protein [Parafilimonas sp.]